MDRGSKPAHIGVARSALIVGREVDGYRGEFVAEADLAHGICAWAGALKSHCASIGDFNREVGHESLASAGGKPR